jgi:hypothetical protein
MTITVTTTITKIMLQTTTITAITIRAVDIVTKIYLSGDFV